MQDNLIVFGTSFQHKVIAAMLSDEQWLVQISDIILSDYFDSDGIKWLCNEIKNYAVQFRTIPTLDVIKVKINDVQNDVLKVSVVEHLKEISKLLSSTDLPFIKDETFKFCKNQCLKKAILESVDLLKLGQYDLIQKSINDALKAGETNEQIGHIYTEEIDNRYNEELLGPRIPTSWNVINDIMRGGLPKKKLSMIMGPTGAGKSWVMANIGAAGILNGFRVIYFTLELDEYEVGQRYDAILTRLSVENLKYHIQEIKNKIITYKDNNIGELIIKFYPAGSIGIKHIENYVEKLRLLNKFPDMILIDYDDLLIDTNGNKEKRFAMDNIYREARGLAAKYNICVWIISQTNRSSVNEDIVTGDMVSEAFVKKMHCDFVLSISRKIEDKVADTARFHIDKSRIGPDGITFPAKMDTSTGLIEIYESQTPNGTIYQKKMNDGDEYMRKLISKRYNTLKNTESNI